MADIHVGEDDIYWFDDDGNLVSGSFPVPIGVAIDEHTIKISGSSLYVSDDAQEVLDALPGWMRRIVVAYAKFRMR